jgi:hypothetical protein
MMKSRALLLVLSAVAVVCSTGAIELPPNRGTELILLMEAEGAAWYVTAIDTPSKWVIQTWDRYNPTYDFILAVTSRSDTGCKVNFFRYVMGTDYVPREEQFEAEFPYSRQARYRFFDRGYVIGFYRISFYDFDPRRLIFPQSSNQTMQPTAGR